MKRFTTEELEEKIKKNWNFWSVNFYFAQVLNGDCTIEETLEDLLSLDEPAQDGGSEG